jgi:hypothetical protein
MSGAIDVIIRPHGEVHLEAKALLLQRAKPLVRLERSLGLVTHIQRTAEFYGLGFGEEELPEPDFE